ncbi:MAG: hypothetical protein AB1405_05725 [Bdellovibrionota bacterium]
MKKFLGMFLGLGLVATLAAGEARADCKICIGASFEGFGYWSNTDEQGSFLGTDINGAPRRARAVYSELVSGIPINASNLGASNDTDFGMYTGALFLNGLAAASDNADLGFRLAFVGVGSNLTSAGGATVGNGDPDIPGGGFGFLVEQAFVDLHNSDGGMGVLFGRFEPNTGGSLRMVDNGTPFLSVARSSLLPTFLTGAVGYFNSGDVGAALYLYNDLNGVNDQDDIDLGYGLGGFYGADGMNASVTVFLSPEGVSLDTGSGDIDQDNEFWVFIINGHAEMEQEQLRAFADITFRRDGYPGPLPSVEAFNLELGGTFNVTDLVGVGANFGWTNIKDTQGSFPLGQLTGLFDQDGHVFVINPVIALNVSDNVVVNAGYDWETQKVKNSGSNGRSNVHTVFVTVAANIDNGAKKRITGTRSVN